MIGSVKYQNFLTDANLAFCQRLAAAENGGKVNAEKHALGLLSLGRVFLSVYLSIGGILFYFLSC